MTKDFLPQTIAHSPTKWVKTKRSRFNPNTQCILLSACTCLLLSSLSHCDDCGPKEEKMPATGSRVRCRTPSPCSLKSSLSPYVTLRDTIAYPLIPIHPIKIENRADLFCQRWRSLSSNISSYQRVKIFLGTKPICRIDRKQWQNIFNLDVPLSPALVDHCSPYCSEM